MGEICTVLPVAGFINFEENLQNISYGLARLTFPYRKLSGSILQYFDDFFLEVCQKKVHWSDAKRFGSIITICWEFLIKLLSLVVFPPLTWKDTFSMKQKIWALRKSPYFNFISFLVLISWTSSYLKPTSQICYIVAYMYHFLQNTWCCKFPRWNRCGVRPVGLAKLGFGVWGLAKKKGTLGQIGVWGCGLGFSLLFLVTSVLGYFIGLVVGTHNSKWYVWHIRKSSLTAFVVLVIKIQLWVLVVIL